MSDRARSISILTKEERRDAIAKQYAEVFGLPELAKVGEHQTSIFRFSLSLIYSWHPHALYSQMFPQIWRYESMLEHLQLMAYCTKELATDCIGICYLYSREAYPHQCRLLWYHTRVLWDCCVTDSHFDHAKWKMSWAASMHCYPKDYSYFSSKSPLSHQNNFNS